MVEIRRLLDDDTIGYIQTVCIQLSLQKASGGPLSSDYSYANRVADLTAATEQLAESIHEHPPAASKIVHNLLKLAAQAALFAQMLDTACMKDSIGVFVPLETLPPEFIFTAEIGDMPEQVDPLIFKQIMEEMEEAKELDNTQIVSTDVDS